MTPARPVVRGCDTCVLRWEDYSWNEDGFAIELHDEICGTVGPNVETYRVTNCCTGNRRFYQVGAYNQYGERWSTLGMPCNDPYDCEPRFGCEGELYEVPSMNRWGCLVLIGLMIGMGAFLIKRRKERKARVL
jgi:hypothetical protein